MMNLFRIFRINEFLLIFFNFVQVLVFNWGCTFGILQCLKQNYPSVLAKSPPEKFVHCKRSKGRFVAKSLQEILVQNLRSRSLREPFYQNHPPMGTLLIKSFPTITLPRDLLKNLLRSCKDSAMRRPLNIFCQDLVEKNPTMILPRHLLCDLAKRSL